MTTYGECNKKITIKQVGYTYIFKIDVMIEDEEVERLHEQLKRSLKEGCVVLPTGVNLISVTPRLEFVLE